MDNVTFGKNFLIKTQNAYLIDKLEHSKLLEKNGIYFNRTTGFSPNITSHEGLLSTDNEGLILNNLHDAFGASVNTPDYGKLQSSLLSLYSDTKMLFTKNATPITIQDSSEFKTHPELKEVFKNIDLFG